MKDYKENLVIGQLIGDALRARYEFKNGKKIKRLSVKIIVTLKLQTVGF